MYLSLCIFVTQVPASGVSSIHSGTCATRADANRPSMSSPISCCSIHTCARCTSTNTRYVRENIPPLHTSLYSFSQINHIEIGCPRIWFANPSAPRALIPPYPINSPLQTFAWPPLSRYYIHKWRLIRPTLDCTPKKPLPNIPHIDLQPNTKHASRCGEVKCHKSTHPHKRVLCHPQKHNPSPSGAGMPCHHRTIISRP